MDTIDYLPIPDQQRSDLRERLDENGKIGYRALRGLRGFGPKFIELVVLANLVSDYTAEEHHAYLKKTKGLPFDDDEATGILDQITKTERELSMLKSMLQNYIKAPRLPRPPALRSDLLRASGLTDLLPGTEE